MMSGGGSSLNGILETEKVERESAVNSQSPAGQRNHTDMHVQGEKDRMVCAKGGYTVK